MKRYLLFVGQEHEKYEFGAGGWNDFVRDGDVPEELRDLGHLMIEGHPMELDWFQVVDTEENKFLFCDADHVNVADDTPHMIEWAQRRGFSELTKERENKIVKLYSHPRSGTVFLLDLLYKNFYKDRKDLSKIVDILLAGHWGRRTPDKTINRYSIDGKETVLTFNMNNSALFGGHALSIGDDVEGIYIMRDGRDVAISCYNWKTWSPLLGEMTLSDFLRWKMDWVGTVGKKGSSGLTIFEHWKEHVENHINNKQMVIIRYEDLFLNQEDTMRKIAGSFDLEFSDDEVCTVNCPVGWNPSGELGISKWKNILTSEDIEYFNSIVPKDFIGRYEVGN